MALALTASRSAGSTLEPGSTLAGKYRVDAVLGRGGMGVILSATHLELGERRAIKLMVGSQSDDGKATQRFMREARAAARLKSEHVVKVFDVGRLDAGDPYMVMELLDGFDLKTLLAERGTLPPGRAVGLVLQALEGLAEAHAAGIVHRDLKPANLFLVEGAGGAACLKVLDFGISKVAAESSSPDGIDMTATHALLGSPRYMSPEQMRSTRDVDVRADIWSMGVILYEMLSGRLPFVGESLTQLCLLVVQTEPLPLTLGDGSAPPPELAAVVMRCLAKDVTARYQDVGQLARALAPFADDASAIERIAWALSGSRSDAKSAARLSDSFPSAGDSLREELTETIKRESSTSLGSSDGEVVDETHSRRKVGGHGDSARKEPAEAPASSAAGSHGRSWRSTVALVVAGAAVAGICGGIVVSSRSPSAPTSSAPLAAPTATAPRQSDASPSAEALGAAVPDASSSPSVASSASPSDARSVPDAMSGAPVAVQLIAPSARSPSPPQVRSTPRIPPPARAPSKPAAVADPFGDSRN